LNLNNEKKILKKILIIGAGNIGKRHIQSIISDKQNSYNIHIIDTSKNFLNRISKEITEINNYKNIKINNNYNDLYHEYDLIIIATTSFKRELIIDFLIKKIIFKNIILEKIVFQNINSYVHYIGLFKKNKIRCWVNCPNRHYKSYNFLKNKLDNNYPMSMIVSGGNWALGSNFVHYTDLFSYFLNEKKFVIDQFCLENKIIKSKRKNFVEFNGIISIKNKYGSFLSIVHNNTNSNVNIKINQKNFSFIFNQKNKFAYVRNRKKDKLKKINFEIPYQSDLTKLYCRELFKYNKINLPTLEEHYSINRIIFNEIIDFYNKNKKIKIIPIT